MRRFLIICLFSLCGILLWKPAPAANPCAASEDIKITVTPVFENTVYDFSYDVAEIQHLANDVVHRVREGWALGLTSYSPVLEMNAPVTVKALASGDYCAQPQEINITVGFRDVTTYLPRELAGDSCGFDKILKHEQEHLTVDRHVLEKYAPLIERRINTYVKLNGGSEEATPEAAIALSRNGLRAPLEEMAQQMADETSRMQQDVDSPQEYNHILNSCNGELADLVRQVRSEPRLFANN